MGFFDTYYVPGNATLVVAGDFDRGEALDLVNKTFGAVPARPLPQHRTAEPVVLEREVFRMATDRVRYPRLFLVWPSPPHFRNGDADMDVIASLLADRSTGRLVERLIRQDKLAQDVTVYQGSQELGSEFHIEVTAAEGQDLEQIKQVVLEEIARLQADGPGADELDRVKAATEANFLRQKESLRRRADMLNSYRKAFGEADSFDRDLARRLAPTAASVMAWSKDVLGDGRLDLRILPGGAAVADADLDQRPDNLSERPSSPAVPTVMKLKNGQPLYVVSMPGTGLFSGRAIISGGETLLPGDQAGLASLCATLATKGAGDLDATAFANAVSALGGQVRAFSSTGSMTMDVSGLTSRLKPTLSLWADALSSPNLTQEDFDREKDLALGKISSRSEDARQLAQVVTSLALFGPADPRGRPGDGFQATVDPLTRDDVTTWAPRLFDPAHASFVFAGDFTPEQIKSALDDLLRGWKGKKSDVVPSLKPIVEPRPGLLLVDRPGAPQTVISIARPVSAPDETDRALRSCVNTLFGGTFTSRLMQNIREKNGYSYGARSSFIEDGPQWVLGAGSAVQTQVTGPALAEFRNEFNGLAGGNVVPGELEKAMRTTRFDLETAQATTGQTAQVIGGFVRNGRSTDALRQDLAALPSVDLAGINGLAQSGIYDWDKLLIVLVGDKETVVPQLKEAGFPAPTLVDEENRPVK